jgi:glutaredoxin 3
VERVAAYRRARARSRARARVAQHASCTSPPPRATLAFAARALPSALAFAAFAAYRSTMASPTDEIKQLVAANRAIIFSKTTCPYCTAAKGAFSSIGVTPHVVELDSFDGATMGAWQDALKGLTGARSVPRVFVGGKFIGGGDDTVALGRSGDLASLCKAAGL